MPQNEFRDIPKRTGPIESLDDEGLRNVIESDHHSGYAKEQARLILSDRRHKELVDRVEALEETLSNIVRGRYSNSHH